MRLRGDQGNLQSRRPVVSTNLTWAVYFKPTTLETVLCQQNRFMKTSKGFMEGFSGGFSADDRKTFGKTYFVCTVISCVWHCAVVVGRAGNEDDDDDDDESLPMGLVA